MDIAELKRLIIETRRETERIRRETEQLRRETEQIYRDIELNENRVKCEIFLQERVRMKELRVYKSCFFNAMVWPVPRHGK